MQGCECIGTNILIQGFVIFILIILIYQIYIMRNEFLVSYQGQRLSGLYGKPLANTVYTSGANLRDDVEFTSTDQGRSRQL